MPRKRERFERTDVPRDNPYRNVIGVVVCVVALALTAAVVYAVWNHVRLESRLGDSALADSLDAQDATFVPDGGYVASEDEIECLLLLTADSLDETGATLSSARILAVNHTQGTASLVNVPVDCGVTADDAATTLSELFSSQGYAACVAPIASAANVSLSHVVVATGDVLEEAASLAGSSPADLVRSASGLLSKMRTDMDATGLLSLAESLSAIGVSNLAVTDATLVPETTTDEAGNVVETGRQVLDRAQVGLALGTLVAAA